MKSGWRGLFTVFLFSILMLCFGADTVKAQPACYGALTDECESTAWTSCVNRFENDSGTYSQCGVSITSNGTLSYANCTASYECEFIEGNLLPPGWPTTTTTAVTTTLCNMVVSSGEPGVLLCLGDSCLESVCVAGDVDYFASWRYAGLNMLGGLTLTNVSWVFGFILTILFFLLFAGVVVFAVLALLRRAWPSKYD